MLEGTIIKVPEAFPKLPALAQRLGVKPNEGNGGWWLCMQDGTRYDGFALINAVLDRLDVAMREPPTVDDLEQQAKLNAGEVATGVANSDGIWVRYYPASKRFAWFDGNGPINKQDAVDRLGAKKRA
jgi:hypothetical protein